MVFTEPFYLPLGLCSDEILLNNILDGGTKEAVPPLKSALVFSEKFLEVMKKHPIKNCEFRITLTVNPSFIGESFKKQKRQGAKTPPIFHLLISVESAGFRTPRKNGE